MPILLYRRKTFRKKTIKRMGLEDKIQVVYRSFQLDVDATAHPDEDIHEIIANKYDITYQQAKENNDKIVAMAGQLDLDFDFINLKPNNTAMAHSIVKFATTESIDTQVVHRFFKAYFEEGRDLGDHETLIELAVEAGLPKEGVKALLQNNVFGDYVSKDQVIAKEIGVNSVPFFVIDNKYAISGAQSEENFEAVIKQVQES